MSSADTEAEAVGRCYTKARRHRHVIGQWDGHRLWGGPYSVPQFVVMAVVLGLMVLLRDLWARFGLFNIVPLVAVPYASSFLVRVLHIDGRNPFSAAFSAAGLAVAGSHGRLGGRPVRAPRAQLLLGVTTLTHHTSGPPAALAETPVPAAVPSRPQAYPDRSVTVAYALLHTRMRQTEKDAELGKVG
ncbi:hypothetical protein ACIG3E_23435 [Streptomyces sp. NPDC053474]|uniref:hypothetical protein n=1 Tax=Streptomyces sp. NPDC053474 TaxID=3365704 RepID=UPI0037D45E3E